MTGHLVLSTLHTNNAVNAITRLIDMGVESFLLASSLRCIIAQRLVRKVCDDCAVPYHPLEEERQLLQKHGFSNPDLRKGKGCRNCDHSGYRGRLAIQEVLIVNEELGRMILQKRPDQDYFDCAVRSGMLPMMKDGLYKVSRGWTTLSEIFRVVHID